MIVDMGEFYFTLWQNAIFHEKMYFKTTLNSEDVFMIETIGHILGILAVGLFVFSYQVSEKKNLLIVQTIATAMMCVQYILIGAYSGFSLNIICIVRNVLYFYRDKKGNSNVWLPIMLALAMALVSLLSWDGYYSLFIVSGLMLNTVCMGVCNVQNLRKSILISCALILTYNLFAGSYGGAINETLSLISAVIGIIRYYSVNGSRCSKGE